jgi:hypothetical protein
MAATQAKIGYGSQLLIASPDAPTTYVALAEITNITPPPMTRDLPEATHMESPGGWKEYVPGLKDGGEISVDMNFIPGSAATLRLLEMQTESEASPVKIKFPGGEEWGFTAFCTGFTPEVPVGDVMTATATFKVTGEPDFTDPS